MSYLVLIGETDFVFPELFYNMKWIINFKKFLNNKCFMLLWILNGLFKVLVEFNPFFIS